MKETIIDYRVDNGTLCSRFRRVFKAKCSFNRLKINREFLASKNYLAVAISWALLLVSFAFAFVCNSVNIIDDAWITFRYAYNLAYKGQLVFNIGERVEGITNLLWAVLLGAQARLFSIPVEKAAILSALIFTFLTIFRVYKIGVTLGLRPLCAVIPPMFIILTPDFWGTLTNGLEAPLFAFLLVESTYWYLRKKFTVSLVALSLLFLTRPESIVVGLILLLAIFIEPDAHGGILPSWWRAALYFGVILGVTLFRLLYYRDLIPNSVRAKFVEISPWLLSSGLGYIRKFLTSNFHLSLVVVTSLIYLVSLLLQRRNLSGIRSLVLDSESRLAIAINLIILLSFVIAIRNGGDWMPNYRLLLQYGALYSVLLVLWIRRKVISLVVALSLLSYPFFQSACSLERVNSYRSMGFVNTRADHLFWAEAVSRVSPNLVPTDVVSAEAIGFISYQLRGFYIHDPLGLTDKHIANHGQSAAPYGKRDISYTLWTVRPSVMIWHWAAHLRALDPGAIDRAYRTYCYQDCDNWEADIVMIRSDRVEEFASQFSDWQVITISSLHTPGE